MRGCILIQVRACRFVDRGMINVFVAFPLRLQHASGPEDHSVRCHRVRELHVSRNRKAQFIWFRVTTQRF